jgi:hypothetical protein
MKRDIEDAPALGADRAICPSLLAPIISRLGSTSDVRRSALDFPAHNPPLKAPNRLMTLVYATEFSRCSRRHAAARFIMPIAFGSRRMTGANIRRVDRNNIIARLQTRCTVSDEYAGRS